MATGTQPKKRIIVLGGGMSALASVFALTNVPDWQQHYDITVYQLGWRLGGKCASGRNADKNFRVEEHGLHVWGGFYENAFWLVKKVYAELARPAGAPLRTWKDAFIGQDTFFLRESDGNLWSFCLPDCKNSEPGFDEANSPQGIREVIFEILDTAQDWFEQILVPEALTDPLVGAPLQALARRTLEELRNTARELVEAGADEVFDGLALLLRFIRRVVKQSILDDNRFDARTNLHRWITSDYLLTALIGIFADNLISLPFDATISHLEFGAWMKQHGMSDETWESPLFHAMYDLVFAFPDGEFGPDKRNADAASMLKVTLQIMRYRGSSIYRMVAGMGDTVIAPIYQVLHARGVKFKFFHNVINLALSGDLKQIDAIEMHKQVRLNGEANGPVEYQPLFDVDGLPCWLSEPLYDQIEHGDELKTRIQAGTLNLEDPASTWQYAENVRLQAGVDFDEVIFGISIGAIPFICQELLQASEDWRKMVANVKTMPTQSFQFWMKPKLSDFGWAKVPADYLPLVSSQGLLQILNCNDDSIATAGQRFVTQPPMVGGLFRTPQQTMDTWVSMDQLIALEKYPAGSVGTIAYFTGLAKFAGAGIPEARIDQNVALQTVKTNVNQLLNQIASPLWGLQATPLDLNNNTIIVDTYLRANTHPSDLYVLSVAGSKKFRLSCQEPHFSNMWIVGDWTGCKLDLGYVEAAVTSGLLMARAFLKDSQIEGYEPRVIGGNDYYWLIS